VFAMSAKLNCFTLEAQEGDYMQRFQGVHSDHEKMTEIYNDYVEEPPESYTELDNPTPEPEIVRAMLSGNDLANTSPDTNNSSSNPPSQGDTT
jgi:hypothetical protein